MMTANQIIDQTDDNAQQNNCKHAFHSTKFTVPCDADTHNCIPLFLYGYAFLRFLFRIQKAIRFMIVYDSASLQIGVDNDCSEEFHAPCFQIGSDLIT